MALKQCTECGNQVSTTAVACPKCGAVQKKSTSSCTSCLGVGLLCFIGLGVLGSLVGSSSTPTRQASPSTPKAGTKVAAEKEETKTYAEGDTAHVGYTSYAVWNSWWSSKLSDNQFLNQKPDAMFLFVQITVRNNDKTARVVPPFKLIDEAGAEYESSSKAIMVEGALGIIDTLNPGVHKQGFIVFDVPKNRTYRLEVSGGYWSTAKTYIALNPKDTLP